MRDSGTAKYLLAAVNSFTEGEFVRALGSIWENSPWIARAASSRRPFATRESVFDAMWREVEAASEEAKIGLIRAHPDLAGRLSRQRNLAAESASEQTAAGLSSLTPGETELFERYNRDYRDRFGFPFVVCARLNDKRSILSAFKLRLENPRSVEVAAALEEIRRIAWLRFADIVEA